MDIVMMNDRVVGPFAICGCGVTTVSRIVRNIRLIGKPRAVWNAKRSGSDGMVHDSPHGDGQRVELQDDLPRAEMARAFGDSGAVGWLASAGESVAVDDIFSLYNHSDIWQRVGSIGMGGMRPLPRIEMGIGYYIRPYFMRIMITSFILLTAVVIGMAVRMMTAPLTCAVSGNIHDRVTCYVRMER